MVRSDHDDMERSRDAPVRRRQRARGAAPCEADGWHAGAGPARRSRVRTRRGRGSCGNALAYALRSVRQAGRSPLRSLPAEPFLHRLVARLPSMRRAVRVCAMHRMQRGDVERARKSRARARRLRQRRRLRRRRRAHRANLERRRGAASRAHHGPDHGANGPSRVAGRESHGGRRPRNVGGASKARLRPRRRLGARSGSAAVLERRSRASAPPQPGSENARATRAPREHGWKASSLARRKRSNCGAGGRRRMHHRSHAVLRRRCRARSGRLACPMPHLRARLVRGREPGACSLELVADAAGYRERSRFCAAAASENSVTSTEMLC